MGKIKRKYKEIKKLYKLEQSENNELRLDSDSKRELISKRDNDLLEKINTIKLLKSKIEECHEKINALTEKLDLSENKNELLKTELSKKLPSKKLLSDKNEKIAQLNFNCSKMHDDYISACNASNDKQFKIDQLESKLRVEDLKFKRLEYKLDVKERVISDLLTNISDLQIKLKILNEVE